jgi:hypothetical protein
LDTAEAYNRCKRSKNSAARSLAEFFACEPPSTCGDPIALAQIELKEQLRKDGFPMILTTEQEARLTGFVNFFGDAFAQDRNTDRMHEWLAIIRNTMVDEWCVPLGHPWLIPQLDWIDRVLDRIEARRKSTRTKYQINRFTNPVSSAGCTRAIWISAGAWLDTTRRPPGLLFNSKSSDELFGCNFGF